MANNQPNPGENSIVGLWYDFIALSYDLNNESFESDYSNGPFITDGELALSTLDDNKTFIYLAPHHFEPGQTFEIT